VFDVCRVRSGRLRVIIFVKLRSSFFSCFFLGDHRKCFFRSFKICCSNMYRPQKSQVVKLCLSNLSNLKNSTISKFQFHLDTVDEEPPYGCATAKTANSHEFPVTYYLYSLYGRVIVSISLSEKALNEDNLTQHCLSLS